MGGLKKSVQSSTLNRAELSETLSELSHMYSCSGLEANIFWVLEAPKSLLGVVLYQSTQYNLSSILIALAWELIMPL